MHSIRHTFFCLGGPAEISIIASSEQQTATLLAASIAEIERIEHKYSRYRADSIVTQINSSAGELPITVDEETAQLINYAASCYAQSNGLFDITSGIFRRVWDFKRKVKPTAKQLKELAPLIGWSKVQWDAPTLYLPHAGMELDFGGFGKEYAVDRVCGVLRDGGATGAMVNLAGDVRVFGNSERGEPWAVGVVHPRHPEAPLGRIGLSAGALATSGDYERFFEHEGKRYCHIINPRTGQPVHELQSVSVLAPACLVAGSATTIAMLLGKKKGRAFLDQLGVPYLMVDQQGRVSGELLTKK